MIRRASIYVSSAVWKLAGLVEEEEEDGGMAGKDWVRSNLRP
jgi:hypothetical protein